MRGHGRDHGLRAAGGRSVTPARVLSRFALQLLAAGFCAFAAGQPAPRSDAAALESAAMRLPALAERIAKLHAQIGQGVLAQRSRRALSEALRDFDASLRSVVASAPAGEARENYVLLGLLWREFRDWAQRAPTRENARRLRERTEEVAWVAAKGARLIHEHSRAAASGAAVRAAQGAMLSQRIPKLYLWRRWDIRDEALASELREAEENLPRAVESLRAAPENTPEIDAELQVVENQLGFMADASRALASGQAGPRQIEFIAKTGDHILESMQRLTRLYELGR
jgi:hypothetical protein